MKIDFPVPSQYPQLMVLWQEAFGDSEEFVDGFFCTGPLKIQQDTAAGQCFGTGGKLLQNKLRIVSMDWCDVVQDQQRSRRKPLGQIGKSQSVR